MPAGRSLPLRPAGTPCDRTTMLTPSLVNHDGQFPFHARHSHVLTPFGDDSFGRRAEAFARLFGTPTFLIVQTAIVAVWIALNFAAASLRWDPYPFILLNLAFSLQAAYAAPLILLAQTRQADRDKILSAADAEHREVLARETLERQQLAAEQERQLRALLLANTELTTQTRDLAEQLKRLTREIHSQVVAPGSLDGRQASR